MPTEAMEAEDAEDALIELADYSLATFAADGESFTIHRLVQEVMLDEQEVAGELDAALASALRWLAVATQNADPQDVRSWPVLEPLQPHALAALSRGTDAHERAARSHLLSRFNVLIYAMAQHALAEPLYRRTLAIDEASYGPDHPNVATHLHNLAGLLYATNRTDEAEPLYRRALAINEASYGSDHPAVATNLNNLALLLSATNRAGEAEPLYRRALAIDEASYGPDHPDVATDLNNLAALLRATNRAGEAEPLYCRAIIILLKTSAATGRAHPNLDAGFKNYASALAELGQSEDEIRAAIASAFREAGLEPPKGAT